jgi:hypothetical protein
MAASIHLTVPTGRGSLVISNLVHNEQVKLAATFWNNLSVAALLGVFLVPAFYTRHTAAAAAGVKLFPKSASITSVARMSEAISELLAALRRPCSERELHNCPHERKGPASKPGLSVRY